MRDPTDRGNFEYNSRIVDSHINSRIYSENYMSRMILEYYRLEQRKDFARIAGNTHGNIDARLTNLGNRIGIGVNILETKVSDIAYIRQVLTTSRAGRELYNIQVNTVETVSIIDSAKRIMQQSNNN